MSTPNARRERDVVAAFVALADELVEDYETVETLTGLAAYCRDLLDVAAAGLLVADGAGRLHLTAAAPETADHLALFQLQREEGPCLDCYRSGEAVAAPDLAPRDLAWPRFSSAARRAGYHSVHALPLRLRGHVIGALGLLRSEPGRIGDDDLDLVRALAHVASVVIVHQRTTLDAQSVNAQLQRALDGRIVVEQAKGVLAHAGDLDMATAFAVLRRYARDRGVKAGDLALSLTRRELSPGVVLAHAREVGVLGPAR